MCGVAGIIAGPRAEPPSLDELRRMIAMLGHRGPDGFGFYRDERVGLAHSRLSIVGLAGGFQPIHNEDRSVWISFNGEIFNHVELRRELEAAGHRFYTATDTEVIVPREGAEIAATAVVQHCRGRLEGHMVPKFVEFRAELPKTESGKLKRSDLAIPA